jgi:hypothetical protein
MYKVTDDCSEPLYICSYFLTQVFLRFHPKECWSLWVLQFSISFSYSMYIVGFEVLTAVVMKSTICWDITSCSPLKVNRRFGGIYRFHLQGREIIRAGKQSLSPAFPLVSYSAYFSTLKMEAIPDFNTQCLLWGIVLLMSTRAPNVMAEWAGILRVVGRSKVIVSSRRLALLAEVFRGFP